MPQVTPSNATFKRVIWSWEGRSSTEDTGITMPNYDWGVSTTHTTGTVVKGLEEGTHWLRVYCSDTNYEDTVDVDVHFLETGKKYFIHNRAYDGNICIPMEKQTYQTGDAVEFFAKQTSDKQWFIFTRNYYDGYITIKNCATNYVIGVENNSTEHDVLTRYYTYNSNSAGQKFKIEPAEDGYVYILPKTGEGDLVKALNANKELGNQHVRQKELNDHHAFQWEIRDYNWIYTISHFIDQGYSLYNQETYDESAAMISQFQDTVSMVMQQLVGIKIEYNIYNGTNYSQIERCKADGGTLDYSHIDDECVSHTPACSDINVLSTQFASRLILYGNRSMTNVLWSNHKIVSVNSPDNRSMSFYTGILNYILMLERTDPTQYNALYHRVKNHTGVFLHEFAHQLQASDHYHEVDEDGNCIRPEICSGDHNQGPLKRPSYCIMNNSRQEINLNNIENLFCPDCLNEMRVFLNLLSVQE